LFAYRLALALGKPSVSEMLGEMSALEFSEWASFYEMDPWGDQRSDIRTGIICSTYANTQRSKNTPAFKPQDFMLFIPRDNFQIEEEEIERRINNFMDRY
jgi:hypothetical protein